MEELTYFTDWTDLAFAGVGLLTGILLVLWWRQQSDNWYGVFSSLLALAAGMSIVSHYLFIIPPHFAACPDGCLGQTGYPLPIAVVTLDGQTVLYPLDFALNLLLIWLGLMTLATLVRVLQVSVDYRLRSGQFRFIFFLIVVVLPWALLPRYVSPPEVQVVQEELRLTVNAKRAAEMTYNITGLWVHRLALEDIRYTPMQVIDPNGGLIQPQTQVCLKGYTYFYLPWRRYIVTLDRTGVTALGMTQVPFDDRCWA